MDYQAIRASMETPLLNAFSALSPDSEFLVTQNGDNIVTQQDEDTLIITAEAVPVYFDNITAVPPNTTTEYVRVNITFGLTNEPTLTSSLDDARGALVIRVFTEKGRGPARNQELITAAVNVLETLNDTPKTDSGVFVRLGQINGPTFSVTDEAPHFVGRIDTGYKATVLF